MRSGGLKDRVSIQKLTTEPDSMGYEVEAWVTVATTWGQLIEDKGNEGLRNDRPIAFRSGSVYLRYRNDITPKHRLQIGNTLWEIESVRTIENGRRREGLEITVRSNE